METASTPTRPEEAPLPDATATPDVAAPARSRRVDVAAVTRIAVFAAIIVVLGVPGAIPVFAVPITLQTLGVMLAGLVLGPWRGLASVAVVVALTAAGLPVLAGGRGGLGVFASPTAGYLVGWLAGVVVVGLVARLGADRPVAWRSALASVLGGVLAIYAFGIPVQALVMGVGIGDAVVQSLVFLPGDLVKAALATVVVATLWKAYPRAFDWPARGATASVSAPASSTASSAAPSAAAGRDD